MYIVLPVMLIAVIIPVIMMIKNKKIFWLPLPSDKKPKEISDTYNFYDGMAKLGNIPDVGMLDDSFAEEVIEHFRKYRD